MTQKAYVVVEKGFEYNDEIYYSHDQTGTPEKVFMDKDKALAFCEELNAKEFSGKEIYQYCYDLNDITSVKEDVLKVSLMDLGIAVDMEYLKIPKGLSLDVLKKVAELFDKLKFFYVVETDID